MKPSAQLITHSISPQGIELKTFQVTMHRFVLPEFNTHRMFSRNFRSSRAVPVKKLIQEVRDNPAMPVWWGKNQAGMQAREELGYDDKLTCQTYWKLAAQKAADFAEVLAERGAHKQIVNRLLEPFLWVHGVVTGTDFANFYALRRHEDAQPEIKALADAMWEAQQASEPKLLQPGEWHLPYVTAVDEHDVYHHLCVANALVEHDYPELAEMNEVLRKLSTARIARVSYNNHDGTRPELAKDIRLHDMLFESKHMSPFEHQATPDEHGSREGKNHTLWRHPDRHGNLNGWIQYRKMLEGEFIPG